MRPIGGGVTPSRGGVVIGIGFGGLLDSFVFHMILQWHHLMTNVIPADSMENLQRLMFFDGLFDAFNFAVLFIGSVLLWRAAYYRSPMPSFGPFMGQILFGVGLFNLIEGTVNHLILAIHYVRQVPEYAYYNWGFLAIGAVLPMILGWVVMRRTGRRSLRG